MSQISGGTRPNTNQSNQNFAPVPGMGNSPAGQYIAPYGRTRDYSASGSSRGPSPVRAAKGPRDYEGYSNAYPGRSESPLPRPPGSSASGGDMWKRGVGYD